MDWRDYLHSTPHGEHVLFSSLKLDTSASGTFAAAALLTVVICLAERAVTFALAEKRIGHARWPRGRLARGAVRTMLYAFATTLRLLYMLISMTFNIWLIVLVIISLSAGQFVTELLDHSHDQRPWSARHGDAAEIPLRSQDDHERLYTDSSDLK
ncbi:hypothetical protein EXIGLDRAFT_833227 [Exidia glandulosa HHB12029]|uniref:Copper transport protein n=1 Tax=Exidia glandulosa HHB12029 TaxID=1314781 RepID=A0A165KVP0_EXIGL|nr:hypothetical protein EXIGLDRAFT_833227 [Exidia glandulosa HHB12029]